MRFVSRWTMKFEGVLVLVLVLVLVPIGLAADRAATTQAPQTVPADLKPLLVGPASEMRLVVDALQRRSQHARRATTPVRLAAAAAAEPADARAAAGRAAARRRRQRPPRRRPVRCRYLPGASRD